MFNSSNIIFTLHRSGQASRIKKNVVDICLDEQIVSCKRDEQNFQRTNRLIFVRLERRFFPDDLPVKTNMSTTVRHKFTSDDQVPDDLSVQMT